VKNISNKIISRIKKKYVFLSISGLILIAIAFLVLLKLLFIVRFSEKDLKSDISIFFKNNLNKAVKFEEAYIDFSGNIIATDFNVSESSDFNDNLSLVKAKKAVFDLNFFRLFIGEIKIDGMDLYDADVTFFKRYGKSYSENLSQVLDLENLKILDRQKFSGFRMRYYDARFFYKEVFKESELQVEFYDIYARLSIDDDEISYRIKGKIKPYKSKLIKKGNFFLKGALCYEKAAKITNEIEIENFDLTCVNEFIREHRPADILLKGGGSADLKITSEKGLNSIKGQVELNNLGVVASLQPQRDLVMNENLNVAIDCDFSDEFKNINLRKFKVYDDIFKITASGAYKCNDKTEKLDVSIKSNKIDLEDFSSTYKPFRDIAFRGALRFEGRINYDFKSNVSGGSDLSLTLKKFGIIKEKPGRGDALITDAELEFKLDDKSMKLGSTVKTEKSDISINADSVVKSWIPFNSDTEIKVRSKILEYRIPYLGMAYFTDMLIGMAYEDIKRGYEDIFFLQKPLGKIINGNNILLDFTADRLAFPGKASMSNIKFMLSLKNGMLEMKDFNAEGYESKCSLAVNCGFNRDYPYINLKGSAKGFNLEGFFRDAGFKGGLAGKADFDFDYEVTAYRMLQLIENSKGNVNIALNNFFAENTEFQRKLVEMFNGTDYRADSLRKMENASVSFSFSQMGENFFIKTFNVRSDGLNLGAFGRYGYQSGLDLQSNVSVKAGDRFITVPLKIDGKILSPCIRINDKKSKNSLCLDFEKP
jgi:hypothetical protein